MRNMTCFLAGAALALGASTANASVVVLDFEGIDTSYPFANGIGILDFYNGGTSSIGSSGSNYGASFDSNAVSLCLNSSTVFCSGSSRGGLAPSSAKGGFMLAEDGEAVLDFAAGFDTAISFAYAQQDAFQIPAAVYVYDGLGGSGNLLGFLDLGYTATACDIGVYGAYFCPFEIASLDFAGIGRSLVFEGSSSYLAFDDVTLGSSTPGWEANGGVPGVPEPSSWALLIAGFGLIGLSARSRRRFAHD